MKTYNFISKSESNDIVVTDVFDVFHKLWEKSFEVDPEGGDVRGRYHDVTITIQFQTEEEFLSFYDI